MRDIRHHWFWGDQRPSAYATAEQLQQEFWWHRLYETHISCARAELPYLFRGYWKGHPFEIELEPRRSLVYRADAELPWVITILTRSLRRSPAFRYQDEDDCCVLEWWVDGQETRWQALQSQPKLKNLERLSDNK